MVLDIDATLVQSVPQGHAMPEGLHVEIVMGLQVAVRPFARDFLRAASKRCRSLSIWTNGTEAWAHAIAHTIFHDVHWTCVLDRRHSLQAGDGTLEKHLTRMFLRQDYPMHPTTTILVDDDAVAAKVNPSNVHPIKPFLLKDEASLDTEFLMLGGALGMFSLCKDPSPLLMMERSRVLRSKTDQVAFDPSPFGLTNQKSVCYFNALAQVLLRSPTVMAMKGMKGASLIEWRERVTKKLGPGQQDASEALLHILPENSIVTPTLGEVGSKTLQESARSMGRPVCLVAVPANGLTAAEALTQAFSWHTVEDTSRDSQRRVCMHFPSSGVGCLVMVVHRNVGSTHKDRGVIVPSTHVVAPNGQIFQLKGVVLHTGNARFGHYTSIFCRAGGGGVWIANDTSVERLKAASTTLAATGRAVSMMVYDCM